MTIASEPRRWLLGVGGLLLILTAAAHAIAQTAGRSDDRAQAVMTAMRSYRLPLGLSDNPSLFDVFASLSYTMSLTFAAIGMLVIAIASSTGVTDRLLRRVAWINALWLAALVALNVVYRLPPPTIAGTLALLTFLAALIPRALTARP